MVLRTARGTVAQPRHREITEMNFDHLAIVLYSYHHQLGDEHGDANKNRTGQSFFEVSETSRKVPRFLSKSEGCQIGTSHLELNQCLTILHSNFLET